MIIFNKTVCSGGNKLLNVKSVITLHLGEGLTWFNKNNRANFSDEEKYNGTFQDVYFVYNEQSSLSSILKNSKCLLKWEGYNVIQTSTDPEKDFCISLQKVSACERSRM